jgi:gluconate 2-dehydrogenase gamma chain
MKRRDTLKALGLTSLGSSVIPSNDVPKPKPELKIPGGRTKIEAERDVKLMAQTFFTPHEMQTITRLADIIIPADAKSGSASQAGVPAFIEFIVKDMPQHQTPMRGGLRWLDSEAIKRYEKDFVLLNNQQQIAIIDDIAYPEKAKPQHTQGVAFFNLMRNLTATGFYTSREGIKDIGYVGNTPNQWNGVPDDVLKQFGLSY